MTRPQRTRVSAIMLRAVLASAAIVCIDPASAARGERAFVYAYVEAIAAATTPSDTVDAAHALLPASDWTAIRSVIGDQLAALRDGDGPRAFSFAAAGIRERFSDAPTFLAMVRESYPALLTARYTEYLEGAVIDGSTIQPLRLVMNDDTVLVALYQMVKDDAGRWRIAGCVIAPSTVRSA